MFDKCVTFEIPIKSDFGIIRRLFVTKFRFKKPNWLCEFLGQVQQMAATI